MSREYFNILGLSPGRYDPAEITRCFLVERHKLLAALDEPGRHEAARRQLDELHRAYRVLSNPRHQAELLDQSAEPLGADRLRMLIAASIEDGLLRYSSRQAILEEARRLGISDFHAQLLIAEVQFGGRRVLSPPHQAAETSPSSAPGSAEPQRYLTRFAAVSMLGAGVFLALLRWLDV